MHKLYDNSHTNHKNLVKRDESGTIMVNEKKDIVAVCYFITIITKTYNFLLTFFFLARVLMLVLICLFPFIDFLFFVSILKAQ